jgi:hypothetical protein
VVVENIAGSLDYVRDVVPLFEIDGCFEVQGEQEAVLMHPCLPFGYGVAFIKMTLKVGFETLDGLADFLVGLLLSVRCVSKCLKKMAWNTTFAEEGVRPRASAINLLDLMYSARRYMKARSLVPVFLSYRSVNYAGVSGYSMVLYVEVTLRDMSKRCRTGSDGEVLCMSRATL